MPGRDNSYQAMARDAVDRMQQRREIAEQLTLLPDERAQAGETDSAETRTRGKGKALNQMREYMAAKGYRMPEEVLIQLAGLDSGLDVFDLAMRLTEDRLAWAFDGATVMRKGKREKVLPSPELRLRTFEGVLAVILRANEALMPYGTPKATPDAGSGPTVQVVVAGAPSPQVADGRPMRDVTHKIGSRMVPADVAWEIEQKQRVSKDDPDQSDSESRTE